MSLFQSLNILETNFYTLTVEHSAAKKENSNYFF